MKNAIVETLKFVLRLIVLVGLPQLVVYLTNAGGDWQSVANAISVLLPIADKYIHENDKIKLNGILPI